MRPTIALIGNGPISKSAAAEIDKFDLVVRMNYARLCGIAGRRTDVLILPIAGHGAREIVYGRPINRLAANGAKQIWLMDSDDPDTLLAEIDRLIIRGRPRVFINASMAREVREILFKFTGTLNTAPTTGLQVLLHLLRVYPDQSIKLFGFTHAGWPGHPWDAEAAWVDELIQAGAVSRAPLDEPFLTEPLHEKVWAETIRLFRQIRRIVTREPIPAVRQKSKGSSASGDFNAGRSRPRRKSFRG